MLLSKCLKDAEEKEGKNKGEHEEADGKQTEKVKKVTVAGQRSNLVFPRKKSKRLAGKRRLLIEEGRVMAELFCFEVCNSYCGRLQEGHPATDVRVYQG